MLIRTSFVQHSISARWLSMLLCLLCLPLAAWGTANQPVNTLPGSSTVITGWQEYLREEQPDILSRYFPGGWVYSGGTHATAGTCTSPSFSVEAFTSAGNRVLANAAGGTVGLDYSTAGCNCANPGSDTAWVIASASSSDTLGNFQRLTGTNLFVNCADANPALPADSAWLMQVTITNGAIATVTSMRRRGPASMAVLSATGDGTTADTTAFQAALDDCPRQGLYIPRPINKYKIGVVTFSSNCTVIIEPGTTIEAVSGLGANDRLFTISNVNNVTILGYGATITQNGLYTSGEQRHNVFITGSNNVRIAGLTSTLAGGDGFYIGAGTQTWSQDVTLEDCIATENRRQGLSIVSGKRVTVRGGRYSDTGQGSAGGTSPQSGIDIEPNGTTDRMEQIVVQGVTTTNNVGIGIAVTTSSFGGAGNRLEITIRDHQSADDTVGFRVIGGDPGATPPIGWIYYNGEVYKSGENGILIRNYDSRSPHITLDHPVVRDANEDSVGGATDGNGITIFKDSLDTGTVTIGNVTIHRPDIYDSRGTARMNFGIYTQDETAIGTMVNVQVLDPIRIAWAASVAATEAFGRIEFTGIVRDSHRAVVMAHTASATLSVTNWAPINTNAGAAGSVTITLDDNLPVNSPPITFENRENGQRLIIVPETGSGMHFSPFGGTEGSFASLVAGARITVQRVSSTVWVILEQTDGWEPSGMTIEIDAQTVTGGVGETTFTTHSRTLEGNTLNLNTGVMVEWFGAGTIAGVNDTKTIRVKFGSTTIATITQAAGETDNWAFVARIYRTGSNTQRVHVLAYQGTGIEAHANSATTETETADIALTVTGQLANAADSIVMRLSEARLVLLGTQ